MGLVDLAVFVLQQVGLGAVEHAGAPGGKGGGMLGGVDAIPAGLDAHELDAVVVQEGVERADGVAASANASHHVVGEMPGCVKHLLAGFDPDDALEVAHQHGVGVGADDAADEVVGGLDVGDPVADGLVDGVLEGAGARLDRDDLGLQQAHPEDVEGLALDVFCAHVDDAVQAQHGAGGGGGDAVLARPGLGDDPLLAHTLGQQGLAQGVVYLVGAGVGQVFPLEVYFRAAAVPGEVFGEVEGRGTAGVSVEEVAQPGLKIRGPP